MEEITLPKAEYDRLVRERDELKSSADEHARLRSEAEKEQEAAEAAKVKAEQERDALQAQVKTFEEKARQETLRGERFEALGKTFVAKLGDKTRARVREQAGTMTDQEWSARLEELEELVGVKRNAAEGSDDDAAKDGKRSEEFSAEEIARSKAGGSNGSGIEQSAAARRSVVAGLLKK